MQLMEPVFTFPISRDPPEGGTRSLHASIAEDGCFQFLGIPPKGEQERRLVLLSFIFWFPISRDPPEGGTGQFKSFVFPQFKFPISRDPPEGGTVGKPTQT